MKLCKAELSKNIASRCLDVDALCKMHCGFNKTKNTKGINTFIHTNKSRECNAEQKNGLTFELYGII